MSNPDNLSTPAPLKAPRSLTADELTAAHAVADALIPATGAAPSASAEPEFDTTLAIALDARADAFDAITNWLAGVAELEQPRSSIDCAISTTRNPIPFRRFRPSLPRRGC